MHLDDSSRMNNLHIRPTNKRTQDSLVAEEVIHRIFASQGTFLDPEYPIFRNGLPDWLGILSYIEEDELRKHLFGRIGAVVLVSVSIAQVATNNGIHPIHFWMMVLCAFELGYLPPPVALNHLLARQAIGPAADFAPDEDLPFHRRYEHILLPMVVMGTALMIVAFVPLFWLA